MTDHRDYDGPIGDVQAAEAFARRAFDVYARPPVPAPAYVAELQLRIDDYGVCEIPLQLAAGKRYACPSPAGRVYELALFNVLADRALVELRAAYPGEAPRVEHFELRPGQSGGLYIRDADGCPRAEARIALTTIAAAPALRLDDLALPAYATPVEARQLRALEQAQARLDATIERVSRRPIVPADDLSGEQLRGIRITTDRVTVGPITFHAPVGQAADAAPPLHAPTAGEQALAGQVVARGWVLDEIVPPTRHYYCANDDGDPIAGATEIRAFDPDRAYMLYLDGGTDGHVEGYTVTREEDGDECERIIAHAVPTPNEAVGAWELHRRLTAEARQPRGRKG